jgi:hypothetical protein
MKSWIRIRPDQFVEPNSGSPPSTPKSPSGSSLSTLKNMVLKFINESKHITSKEKIFVQDDLINKLKPKEMVKDAY